MVGRRRSPECKGVVIVMQASALEGRFDSRTFDALAPLRFSIGRDNRLVPRARRLATPAGARVQLPQPRLVMRS
jgi:hypothetical protein